MAAKEAELEQASAANYLKEWMLEDRSRNLGGEPGTPHFGPGPRARVRAACRRAARAPAPNERTVVGGNRKMTYANKQRKGGSFPPQSPWPELLKGGGRANEE